VPCGDEKQLDQTALRTPGAVHGLPILGHLQSGPTGTPDIAAAPQTK